MIPWAIAAFVVLELMFLFVLCCLACLPRT